MILLYYRKTPAVGASALRIDDPIHPSSNAGTASPDIDPADVRLMHADSISPSLMAVISVN